MNRLSLKIKNLLFANDSRKTKFLFFWAMLIFPIVALCVLTKKVGKSFQEIETQISQCNNDYYDNIKPDLEKQLEKIKAPRLDEKDLQVLKKHFTDISECAKNYADLNVQYYDVVKASQETISDMDETVEANKLTIGELKSALDIHVAQSNDARNALLKLLNTTVLILEKVKRELNTCYEDEPETCDTDTNTLYSIIEDLDERQKTIVKDLDLNDDDGALATLSYVIQGEINSLTEQYNKVFVERKELQLQLNNVNKAFEVAGKWIDSKIVSDIHGLKVKKPFSDTACNTIKAQGQVYVDGGPARNLAEMKGIQNICTSGTNLFCKLREAADNNVYHAEIFLNLKVTKHQEKSYCLVAPNSEDIILLTQFFSNNENIKEYDIRNVDIALAHGSNKMIKRSMTPN